MATITRKSTAANRLNVRCNFFRLKQTAAVVFCVLPDFIRMPTRLFFMCGNILAEMSRHDLNQEIFQIIRLHDFDEHASFLIKVSYQHCDCLSDTVDEALIDISEKISG